MWFSVRLACTVIAAMLHVCFAQNCGSGCYGGQFCCYNDHCCAAGYSCCVKSCCAPGSFCCGNLATGIVCCSAPSFCQNNQCMNPLPPLLPSSSSSSGSRAGPIAGGVVGGLVLVGAIVLFIVYQRKKRRASPHIVFSNPNFGSTPGDQPLSAPEAPGWEAPGMYQQPINAPVASGSRGRHYNVLVRCEAPGVYVAEVTQPSSNAILGSQA
jgi:hypothetical protein